jgi:hypothetical protein
MKHLVTRTALVVTLFALSACGSVFWPATSSKPEAAKPVVNATAYNNRDCAAQADSKLKLFDRPDTYPISAEERNNARDALYSECVNGKNSQIANNGAYKSDTQTPQSMASLANLSPAAGGNATTGAGRVSTTSYPGQTVVTIQGNDPASLANLSPSAGGNATQGNIAGAYPGATVVVVQSPTAAAPAPRPAPVMPTALARPVPVAAQAQKSVTVANTNPNPLAVHTTYENTAPEAAPAQQLYAQPPAYKTVPTATVNAPDAATQQLERILSQ